MKKKNLSKQKVEFFNKLHLAMQGYGNFEEDIEKYFTKKFGKDTSGYHYGNLNESDYIPLLKIFQKHFHKINDKVVYIQADFKDVEELINGFIKAIKMLGGNVYKDPNFEGSDSYGFMVTNHKLTKEELKLLNSHG